MKKICKHCNEEFSARINKMEYCKKQECRNAKAKFYYDTKMYHKECTMCHSEFEGNIRTILCDNCKQFKPMLRRNGLKDVIQTMRCRRCYAEMGTIVKKMTKTFEDGAFYLCVECRSASSKARSESKMGEKNPNYNPNKSYIVIKKERPNGTFARLTYYPSKETIDKCRARMSAKNPMHNSETVDKMKETTKSRRNQGMYINSYRKGALSPLWKGNKSAYALIRIRVRWWSKENMIRTNFTCEVCNASKCYLEVHHNEPLRDIIQKFITKPLNEYDVLSPEFDNLTESISNYHKSTCNLGTVVCKTCHSKIDKFRHI